jgi:hypothetical protein
MEGRLKQHPTGPSLRHLGAVTAFFFRPLFFRAVHAAPGGVATASFFFLRKASLLGPCLGQVFFRAV